MRNVLLGKWCERFVGKSLCNVFLVLDEIENV